MTGEQEAEPPARGHGLPGLEPVSRNFGLDRGKSVDRAYIHEFLWERRDDVHGRVLEIADSGYTDYLGEGAVTQVDVLHAKEDLPWVTLVGDLATGEGIPTGAFDCIILTQTLQLIYEVPAALRHCHRILKPGGTLLVTVPVVSRVIAEPDRFLDYWRFTEHSCLRLFREYFGDDVEVTSHGNVLSSVAFLMGMAHEELRRWELDHQDPNFAMLVTVRARK